MKTQTEQKYKQLTLEKKLQIEALYQTGMKVVDIAEQLGVYHTTIYRELKRGKDSQRNSGYSDEAIQCLN